MDFRHFATQSILPLMTMMLMCWIHRNKSKNKTKKKYFHKKYFSSTYTFTFIKHSFLFFGKQTDQQYDK